MISGQIGFERADSAIVYIVDDEADARDSLEALVRSMGVQTMAFESAEGFLEGFSPSAFGCLVTDHRMVGMNGIELQERLAEAGISLPVIIVTGHANTPMTVRAVKGGAITVLDKPYRDTELVAAIRAGLEKNAEDRNRCLEADHVREFAERLATLTPKERQVLDFMVDGLANKVIAKRMDVSVRTIENRRQQIFVKTGTTSLAVLVRLFVEARGIPRVESSTSGCEPVSQSG